MQNRQQAHTHASAHGSDLTLSLFPFVTKYLRGNNAKIQEKGTMDHKSKESLTQAILDVRRIKNERGRPTTYCAIAEIFGPPVTRIVIWRLVNDCDYEPKRSDIRAALNLPILAPTPVCPTHGIVHPGRCPRPTKPRLPWLTPEEVEERLDWIRRNYGKRT